MTTPDLNDHHRRKLRQLAETIGVPLESLPIIGRVKGWVFTQVGGVTVLITATSRNPEDNGGFIVPSLHTYDERMIPSNLQAAANARRLYDDQLRALGNARYDYDYGHRGPVVDLEWSCHDPACRCSQEHDVEKERTAQHWSEEKT